MSTAETLRAAAEHIEQAGLNRSGGYFENENRPVPIENRRCCALGAIAVVLDPQRSRALLNLHDPKYSPELVDPPLERPEGGLYGDWSARIHAGPEATALQAVLDRRQGGKGLWITAWSDYRAKDKHEVADVLREAAADLEGQA